ncbi:MAG: hypothetical protein LRY55_06550 [Leadbetterella sp.]|nr:hypothetical protein [Leadbetterella sp.]
MTGHFVKITQDDLREIVKPRPGETRIGEVIALTANENTRYELIGDPGIHWGAGQLRHRRVRKPPGRVSWQPF